MLNRFGLRCDHRIGDRASGCRGRSQDDGHHHPSVYPEIQDPKVDFQLDGYQRPLADHRLVGRLLGGRLLGVHPRLGCSLDANRDRF